MDRWQILLIVALGTAAWLAYTRFVRRGPSERYSLHPPLPEVEDWFTEVQEKIEAMDDERRLAGEAVWRAMRERERQEFSDAFILEKFGQRAINGYNRKQRMQLGLAHYLIEADVDT